MPCSIIYKSCTYYFTSIAHKISFDILFLRSNNCYIIYYISHGKMTFFIRMCSYNQTDCLKKRCHIFRWIKITIRWLMDKKSPRPDLLNTIKTISEDLNTIYIYCIDNSEAIKENTSTL